MAKQKAKEKIFDFGAYDRAIAYGDKHEVAIDKGWGSKSEGESKDIVIAEE